MVVKRKNHAKSALPTRNQLVKTLLVNSVRLVAEILRIAQQKVVRLRKMQSRHKLATRHASKLEVAANVGITVKEAAEIAVRVIIIVKIIMHLRQIIQRSRNWSVLALLMILVCLGACAPKHTSYSCFYDMPDEGWMENTPISFAPEYGDSTITYDITFSVRHSASYSYGNLNLVLDFIAADGNVDRKNLNFAISDEFGNFKGGGFGDYYQRSQLVVSDVKPDDVSKIVVWPAMTGCKTLTGIHNLGITITPHRK